MELWISVLFVLLILSAGGFAYLRRRRTLEAWRTEHLREESGEPREVPYTVNYTIVRNRTLGDDQVESPPNEPPYDRPKPGN